MVTSVRRKLMNCSCNVLSSIVAIPIPPRMIKAPHKIPQTWEGPLPVGGCLLVRDGHSDEQNVRGVEVACMERREGKSSKGWSTWPSRCALRRKRHKQMSQRQWLRKTKGVGRVGDGGDRWNPEAEPAVRLWAVMSAAVPMQDGPPRPVLGEATARSGRPGRRGACVLGGWKWGRKGLQSQTQSYQQLLLWDVISEKSGHRKKCWDRRSSDASSRKTRMKMQNCSPASRRGCVLSFHSLHLSEDPDLVIRSHHSCSHPHETSSKC